MAEPLSNQEKKTLLEVARRAIGLYLQQRTMEKIDLQNCTPNLMEPGASFVTLSTLPGKQLRGCIGALEPYQPLILDVQEHAIAAAFEDYRFPPLHARELACVQIEISRLTPPLALEHRSPEELLLKLQPGVDGVILRDGFQRATFLPQVWEKMRSKEDFLNQLCLKMGVDRDFWKRKKLEVFTYQVEEFHEESL